MRVAIEARRLQDRPLGGVGRGLAHLVPAVARLVDTTVLVDARRGAVPPPAATARLETIGAPGRAPGSVWLQVGAGRWARRSLRQPGSVFHGTFNALPAGLPCASVVSIYDLSFEVHPEDFGPARRRAFQVQARAAARSAGRIITASRFTAGQLTDCYGVAPDRVVVTPWTFDPLFHPDRAAAAAAATARVGLDGGRPYVVCVGGARRRGSEVAVAAWRAVRARGVDVDLLVVGAAASPPEPHLHLAGALDDDTWAALLAGAEALVYPTRYEGFGLPALEAAASGTPVVCAAVGPLPEVLGDAAEWCARPVARFIADGLEHVLTDRARHDELRAAGLDRCAAAPSWDDVAAQTVAAYREALDG